MSLERVATPAELDQENLKALCGSDGPCVSIFLPPYRGGELNRPSPIWLHDAIALSAQRLADLGESQTDTRTLLGNLRSLTENPELGRGHAKGLAVFCSPEVLHYFETPGLTEDMVVVAERFHVLPLITLLARPRLFHVLLLGRENVRLLRCTDQESHDVPLPHGLPKSLQDAMALSPPDHNLESRSIAGPSQGAMRGVSFGTGSGRERKHEHLREFFSLLDRGLRPLLERDHAPLVLAGVAYETEIYQKISEYENIVAGAVTGSPVEWAQQEIVQASLSVLGAAIDAQHQKMLAEMANQVGDGLILSDAASALSAASEGRVRELLVARGVKVMGNFYDVLGRPPAAHPASPAQEDLLNATAVETIRHGGRVWTLPLPMMPGKSPITALLRY